MENDKYSIGKNGQIQIGDRVSFGGHIYSAQYQNVTYLNTLADHRIGSGFHWKHDIYFKRMEDGTIRIRHCADWNYCPRFIDWVIPALEWKSIVSQLQEP